MNFILDTNIVTGFIKGEVSILRQFNNHRVDTIYLCQPVYYESMRGLLWKNSTSSILTLQRLRLRLGWIELTDEHWDLASHLWADMTSKGRQLSDVDLLIAAIAIRHDAVIVTADDDFDALPLSRENWRNL